MDPRARGAFLGLAAQHDHGDIVRAVMEGVTFACRDAFAALHEAGRGPERIVMAGGGGRSPFWRQMVADVFGLPVYASGDDGSIGHGRGAAGARGIQEPRSGRDRAALGSVRARRGAECQRGTSVYEEVYGSFGTRTLRSSG